MEEVPEEQLFLDSIAYSSGNTSEEIEGNLKQIYLAMSEEKQDDHIFDLWKKLYSRLRGALKIINTFGDIAMELNVLGKDKKSKELEELE